jgi:hypothetical protein
MNFLPLFDTVRQLKLKCQIKSISGGEKLGDVLRIIQTGTQLSGEAGLLSDALQ